jgi:hypothetical protein
MSRPVSRLDDLIGMKDPLARVHCGFGLNRQTTSNGSFWETPNERRAIAAAAGAKRKRRAPSRRRGIATNGRNERLQQAVEKVFLTVNTSESRCERTGIAS